MTQPTLRKFTADFGVVHGLPRGPNPLEDFSINHARFSVTELVEYGLANKPDWNACIRNPVVLGNRLPSVPDRIEAIMSIDSIGRRNPSSI